MEMLERKRKEQRKDDTMKTRCEVNAIPHPLLCNRRAKGLSFYLVVVVPGKSTLEISPKGYIARLHRFPDSILQAFMAHAQTL